MARTARPPAQDLAAIEAAMIRIRRRQSRRTLGRAANEGLAEPVNPDHMAVLDAVEEGQETGGEVSVGDLASRLGIDPSRASRVVAAAIEAGHLQRIASQGDGRRSCLAFTPAGREIIAHAHRARRALFDRLLRDWTDRDRKDLARLLTRFTDALVHADRDGTP